MRSKVSARSVLPDYYFASSCSVMQGREVLQVVPFHTALDRYLLATLTKCGKQRRQSEVFKYCPCVAACCLSIDEIFPIKLHKSTTEIWIYLTLHINIVVFSGNASVILHSAPILVRSLRFFVDFFIFNSQFIHLLTLLYARVYCLLKFYHIGLWFSGFLTSSDDYLGTGPLSNLAKAILTPCSKYVHWSLMTKNLLKLKFSNFSAFYFAAVTYSKHWSQPLWIIK